MKATVYRYFDKYGILLYVGFTVSGPKRKLAHAGQAQWWSSVATATFAHYRSVTAALAAERHAIETENPIWNKMHRDPGFPTLGDAVDGLNALYERQRPPYTIDQLAHAIGRRADILEADLDRSGVPYRGAARRRLYSLGHIATFLGSFPDEYGQ